MSTPAIQLNPEQLRAVRCTEGPLLILAGAGSGKTRVLVQRIAHILDQGLAEPWQLMAVTFTNKAAQEMRQRLLAHVGPDIHQAWIGTFHAMSARILRMEGHRLGIPRTFSIYDSDDAKRTAKGVMQAMGLQTAAADLRGVLHAIDQAKNAGIGPRDFAAAASDRDPPGRRLAREVYPRYEQALRDSRAVDFGGILLLTAQLLESQPEVRKRFAGRFKYLMVDEFQDTNPVQYGLLRALSSVHHNLAVVGDDDQAIYRWRGAEVKNILGFSRDHPGTTVVTLEENYRSSHNILRAANAVIRNNRARHPKTLRTAQAPGLPVGLALVSSGHDEAALITQDLATRLDAGAAPGDFAVLYRANAQSRLFEEALRRAEIPHALVGATGFYERAEVKDVVAYLRLTANPASQQDFLRIVNVPARRLGKTTVARLVQAAAQAGVQGAEVLDLEPAALIEVGVGKPALKRLRELQSILQELRELAEEASAAEVARAVIQRTGYEAHLRRADPVTADDRIDNVRELVTAITDQETRLQDTPSPEGLGLAGADSPLQAFLDQAALLSAQEQLPEGEAVQLMTLHAAKGLEFPVVYMAGMEEGSFPVARVVMSEDPEAIEEERRLCYVGMTRAMRELNLVAAQVRMIYGEHKVQQPSRFLNELPEAIIGDFGRHPAADLPSPTLPSPTRPRAALPRPHTPPPDRPAPPPPEERVVRDDSPPDDPYAPGCWVHHLLFQRGKILDRQGQGRRARLTIRFASGDKRVLARYVNPD